MILLHRITPFVLGLLLAVGMFFLVFGKIGHVSVAIAMVVIALILFARLLRFEIRTFQFWHFLLTPVLFLIASLSLIFFLEQDFIILLVAFIALLLIVLYAEYVFQFLHLPTMYQPYSLEYVSLVLHLLTIFSLSSVGFGSMLLLQAPLSVVAIVAFFCFVFVIYGTFWVSKAHESTMKPYTLGGSILMTELFVALSVLPSSYYTNAAIMTVLFYLFIGLTRAHVLRTLSSLVIKRYVIVSGILLLATILSSQWL